MLPILQALRNQPILLSREDLALAEAHHVLASIPNLPPQLLRQVHQQAFFWSHELRGLISAFAAAAIPMIPLKGPAFAERAYGAAHLRTCRDLDLLVQPVHLPAAELLLEQLGFQPLSAGDDYHRPWIRNTTAVELHHGIAIPHTFNFDLAGAWSRAEARARPATEQGSHRLTSSLHFAPADELLYLCLHGARHRFDRLSIALDIHYALKRALPAGSTILTPSLLQQATAQNLTGPLLVGTALAARLMGQPFECPLWITPLVDELWTDLTSGPPVTWYTPDLYRFYLRLEPTTTARQRRRLTHARVALSRLIPEDFAFAARFGVRSRPAVRILRALRLLLRYARS